MTDHVMHIYYASNIHDACPKFKAFSSLSRAERWAARESDRTGCTFIVAQGLHWFSRDRGTPCPHRAFKKKGRRKSK